MKIVENVDHYVVELLMAVAFPCEGQFSREGQLKRCRGSNATDLYCHSLSSENTNKIPNLIQIQILIQIHCNWSILEWPQSTKALIWSNRLEYIRSSNESFTIYCKYEKSVLYSEEIKEYKYKTDDTSMGSLLPSKASHT